MESLARVSKQKGWLGSLVGDVGGRGDRGSVGYPEGRENWGD